MCVCVSVGVRVSGVCEVAYNEYQLLCIGKPGKWRTGGNNWNHYLSLPPLPPSYTSASKLLRRIEIAGTWCDQGWGNRKGLILLRLMRGNEYLYINR